MTTQIFSTANITGGNVIGSALVQGVTVSASGNVVGGNVNTVGLSTASRFVSNVAVGTAPMTVTSNTVVSNFNADLLDGQEGSFYQNATNLNAGTVSADRLSGTYTITVDGAATTAGTVTTAAQPNITSVGTLTSLSVTGNVIGGNLITAGLVSLSSITKTGTNGVGNIGAVGNTFNTIFARATSAQYADLAEMYLADAEYAPGTVLSFGGTAEVTVSCSADPRVAGVVSTNPAHIMNSNLDGEYPVALALTGRVPTQVTGTVRKGDMMISAGNGHAQACSTPAIGTVIGKALEDFEGNTGVIEIVVGRL
jgi:hypothetical protein